MARKKSPTLTDAELRLMQILWDRGRATVGEVVAALPRRCKLAYNTVLTTLRILESKGHVSHKKEGRAFVYAPRIDRSSAQRSALRHVVSRFFEGSAESLVLNLLADRRLNRHERDRLQKMIQESE